MNVAKHFCNIIIGVSLFAFLTSCKTIHDYSFSSNEGKNENQSNLSDKQTHQTPLNALILYASDDPVLLPHFSKSFTERINKEKEILVKQVEATE